VDSFGGLLAAQLEARRLSLVRDQVSATSSSTRKPKACSISEISRKRRKYP
jgi:hypothetical protein